MKPAVQKLPISNEEAFDIKHLTDSFFDPHWHFHSEYQLFLVVRGTGTRFVGDHVGPFHDGELILTGPDLPHLWHSDREYFQESGITSEGIVIYFTDHFLGKDFLQKREAFKISQLLQKAKRGMKFSGALSHHAAELMNALLVAKDFDRVLTFMNLLDQLSKSSNYQLLASEGYTNSMKESDTDRMNHVHDYVLKNFSTMISQKDVAAVAHLSPTSFSRYFKMHANKTFSDFLMEIRIGHACKLLTNQNIGVAQVCYESGFSTLSHFNKQFKSFTHYTPLAYKKKYIQLMNY